MIPQETIEKAQAFARKKMNGYCDEYLIDMVEAIIDDKCTDTRWGDGMRIFEAGDNVKYFLDHYLNGRTDVVFVIKEMPLGERIDLAKGIMSILREGIEEDG